MNIYRQELKMYSRSVVIWSAAIAALLFVFVSLFSSFSQQAATMNEMLAKFPPELLKAFGMDLAIDLSTVLGFFGFIFLFVQICMAIQAANYGFSLVSIEEREWTADFLLTKPVTRRRIMTEKLLAALTGLTITNAVTWIASFVLINIFRQGKAYEAGHLILLLSSIIVFQLFFLSLGVAISLLVKRVRSVVPYAMGLGFGMYVISVFGSFLGTNVIEDITPFKQFDPNYILQKGSYDVPLAALCVMVTVVAVMLSYWLYTRRDIPAVV